MNVDLRLSLGLLFAILGSILVVTGLVTNTELNTSWGSAMVLFGAMCIAIVAFLRPRR